VAIAAAILDGRAYVDTVREYGRRFPSAGYGARFFRWLRETEGAPYRSWGNGSAMRVSPVGFAFDTEQSVLDEARKSAQITHDHPAGIAGAQAVANAIWLARQRASKEIIRQVIERRFGYDLGRTVEAIRPQYRFDVSCPGSVPEAIIAFLDADDWESAVRNAVSLGGDSDTQACIAGGIAEAFYGPVPKWVRLEVRRRLPEELWDMVQRFSERFFRS
jgi:ADP-ribosylglycohydrolase